MFQELYFIGEMEWSEDEMGKVCNTHGEIKKYKIWAEKNLMRTGPSETPVRLLEIILKWILNK
jgi:hypothetical protein